MKRVFAHAERSSMSEIETKLSALGLELPTPPKPVASYVPFVQVGTLLFISGQVSVASTGIITGKVGRDINLTEAQEAARMCGLNILAQAKAALDRDLTKLKQVVRLGGFVNAAPDFLDIPQVINGCSDFFVELMGEAGKHARSAVGCSELPLNVAVEVDAILETN